MIKTTIGLEIHLRINLERKIFSDSLNHFSKSSNKNISPFDLAFPGKKPKFNHQIIEKAHILSKIFNNKLEDVLKFDRKHYNYLDLPKGFQITQFFHPIFKNGFFKYLYNNSFENVARIKEFHIEEDTAKLKNLNEYIAIDYNRSGTPLIEIVTEPDFSNSKQVFAFLKNLFFVLKINNLSDLNLENGDMRIDVNIVSYKLKDVKNKDNLYFIENETQRTEIKNINSFKYCAKAIEKEIFLQKKLLSENLVKKSSEVITKSYDYQKDSLSIMRSKSNYHYLNETNLQEINISNGIEKNHRIITNEFIENLNKSIFAKNNISLEKIINNITRTFSNLFIFYKDKKIDSMQFTELIKICNSINIEINIENLPLVIKFIDFILIKKDLNKSIKKILIESFVSDLNFDYQKKYTELNDNFLANNKQIINKFSLLKVDKNFHKFFIDNRKNIKKILIRDIIKLVKTNLFDFNLIETFIKDFDQLIKENEKI